MEDDIISSFKETDIECSYQYEVKKTNITRVIGGQSGEKR